MFASTERAELATVWEELIAGTCKVESWWHDENTWSMVVSRRPTLTRAPGAGLRARDVEILEHALLCGVRKHVAVEAGLSCSSIAVILQTCFQFMGLHCLPSRIPGLLVAAAHARHAVSALHSPLRGRADRQFSEQLVAVPRPDTALAAWLAPAEHAVVSLLIEGHCYAEIAEARHTSIRTVANQVASAFRRLGVSGRAELLCLLARWGLEAPKSPVRRPPTSATPPSMRRSASRSSRSLEEASARPHLLSPSLAT